MRVGVWLHPDILFIPSSKKLSVVLGGGECELKFTGFFSKKNPAGKERSRIVSWHTC